MQPRDAHANIRVRLTFSPTIFLLLLLLLLIACCCNEVNPLEVDLVRRVDALPMVVDSYAWVEGAPNPQPVRLLILFTETAVSAFSADLIEQKSLPRFDLQQLSHGKPIALRLHHSPSKDPDEGVLINAWMAQGLPTQYLQLKLNPDGTFMHGMVTKSDVPIIMIGGLDFEKLKIQQGEGLFTQGSSVGNLLPPSPFTSLVGSFYSGSWLKVNCDENKLQLIHFPWYLNMAQPWQQYSGLLTLAGGAGTHRANNDQRRQQGSGRPHCPSTTQVGPTWIDKAGPSNWFKPNEVFQSVMQVKVCKPKLPLLPHHRPALNEPCALLYVLVSQSHSRTLLHHSVYKELGLEMVTSAKGTSHALEWQPGQAAQPPSSFDDDEEEGEDKSAGVVGVPIAIGDSLLVTTMVKDWNPDKTGLPSSTSSVFLQDKGIFHTLTTPSQGGGLGLGLNQFPIVLNDVDVKLIIGNDMITQALGKIHVRPALHNEYLGQAAIWYEFLGAGALAGRIYTKS